MTEAPHGLGQLQTKNGDAAGSQHQHGVAGLEAAIADQRPPGREAGRGQGGAFRRPTSRGAPS